MLKSYPANMWTTSVDRLQVAIEQLWESGYDDPEDVVVEVREQAALWWRGFTDTCHCNRPPRDCNCP